MKSQAPTKFIQKTYSTVFLMTFLQENQIEKDISTSASKN